MSILTMTPCPEWYEPTDVWDWDQEDDEICPPEALSVDSGRVWWSASLDLPDTDE